MERTEKSGDLYIDPVFDTTQGWIWTSDLYSTSYAWVVSFDGGYCYYGDFDDDVYARAVR